MRLQQFVEVEDRREVAADLVQQQQRLRLARNARVKARVLDADRNTRSRRPSGAAHVLRREVVGAGSLRCR